MEALMLVRATAPSRWTPLYLSQRLYVSHATAAGMLADLCNAGLLLRDDATARCFYQRHPTPVCDSIERLAALYASNLVDLTVQIRDRRRTALDQ
jgi:hypothetical protein